MGELIPLREARKRLGISKTTMGKLVREGRFTIYENPRDQREKLVDAEEVDAAMQPRPIQHRKHKEGKAAA